MFSHEAWLNELHPDLRDAVRTHANGHITLAHPCYLVEFATLLPASQINGYYEAQLRTINEYKEQGDWDHYVDLHPKRSRLRALKSIGSQLSDAEWWSMLSDVWTDSENIFELVDEWLQELRSSRSHKHRFMSAEDLETFQSLPAQLTIYRGYQPNKNRKGLSWTLSKEIAMRLSNNVVPPGTDLKFTGKGGKIRQKSIAKSEAFAFLNEREEQEIIFLGDY